MSNVTPARNEAASTHTPLRTPGSVGGSPDPAQLVERLQSLKSRLSNMTKTLEQSVAAASPLRGNANEDILYSTPKHVMQLLEGPLGQDASLFLAPDEAVPADSTITEVRFTLSATSEEEMAMLVKLLDIAEAAGSNGKA